MLTFLAVFIGNTALAEQKTELAMGQSVYPPAGGIWKTPPAQGALSPLSGKSLKTVVFVTNRDSGDVTVIDAQTDQIINRVNLESWVNSHMAMSMQMGGKKMLLVSGTQKNVVYLIDLDNGTAKVVPTGLAPEHFDASPDGHTAYFANIDGGSISAVDIMAGKELARIEGFYEPHGVTFHPTLKKAYIPNLGAHEVGVIDTVEHKLIKRIAIGELPKVAALNPDKYLGEIQGIVNVTLTPDGRYAYAADGDSGQVGVIDTATDEVVKTLQTGEEPWRAYASPDGKWMMIPNNGDETVTVIDARKHKVVATLPGGAGMTGINYALDNRKAYVIAAEDSSVLVYNLPSFTSKKLVLGKNLALETAATTPDGKKVYVAASTDNSVYVINAEDDQVKRIANVGQFPWGVAIMDGQNYCH